METNKDFGKWFNSYMSHFELPTESNYRFCEDAFKAGQANRGEKIKELVEKNNELHKIASELDKEVALYRTNQFFLGSERVKELEAKIHMIASAADSSCKELKVRLVKAESVINETDGCLCGYCSHKAREYFEQKEEL